MNAFVKLEGSFPARQFRASGSARPVRLFLQTASCGARVGQVLRVKNSDQPAPQRPQQLEQAQQFQRRSAPGRHLSDFKLSDERC